MVIQREKKRRKRRKSNKKPQLLPLNSLVKKRVILAQFNYLVEPEPKLSKKEQKKKELEELDSLLNSMGVSQTADNKEQKKEDQ